MIRFTLPDDEIGRLEEVPRICDALKLRLWARIILLERFWKLLRRQATHNRLFASLAALKRWRRASLCYHQTVRGKIRSASAKCYPPPQERTAIPGT